jgi:hypothetical protein
MQTNDLRLSRREVIKFFAAMTATVAAHDLTALAQAPQSVPPLAKCYGSDPDLVKMYKPGDVWPLTLSAEERKATAALADLIFPADDLGPAASTLRVADYIDEWVSAPYPAQQNDRPVLLEGIGWLDAEAQKRFTKTFAELSVEQQSAICDDICWPADAKPEFRKAAQFFLLFRGLAAGAYYATPEGWKALVYVGNVALATFDGPPPEVLERLGLEQTVK